ncbi:FAD-binding domain-containing protein [Sphingomonas sp. MMS24-J45]|uniref:FAD-binding domain-containing protein n=1 Tax=Sphingomonas sp. MMS24-J45 TaxID=3238806 RepID=UPI00384FCF80
MAAPVSFPPNRDAALDRLQAFVLRAGVDYARDRNADLGPEARSNVSLLSPYLRHRLMTEREVVSAVLARHSFSEAEKFVQEVLWRTYWKGWLELRPAIWGRYLAELDAVRARFRGAKALASAENGTTGIEGFDDWARELVETGYLHNHARMWFASIWIFTLRLPWTLGADFFLRHLLDGDPASNTLSWRWVAGLQTIGKTYLATADNIARYTGGRFAPQGLTTSAVPLTEAPLPAVTPLLAPVSLDPDAPALLLVTPEDFHPESVFAQDRRFVQAIILADRGSGGALSEVFVAAAAHDCAGRVEAHFGCPTRIITGIDPAKLIAAAQDAQVTTIATAYAPVGHVADALRAATPVLQAAGIDLIQVQRAWDTHFWPHAKKGFFAFKEQIPRILGERF